MTIKDLQPALVFDIFDQITQVPRPSKKEGKIRQFLLDFAAAHGIEVRTDAIGNVVMTKPATPGHEQAPTVIMQAHMDMVCESNDKNFDFDNEPIRTIVDVNGSAPTAPLSAPTTASAWLPQWRHLSTTSSCTVRWKLFSQSMKKPV